MRNMKKTAFFLLLAVCGLWACNDNWNDYYDGSSVSGSVDTATTVLDCSIIEFFQTHAEYAEFYKLLQDVGAMSSLEADQELTVWAVGNSGVTAAAGEYTEGSLATDTTRVKYHVNYLSFNRDQLKNGARLKTLNGIYVQITIDEAGDIYANASKVLKTYRLNNGVIHVIDEMMAARINLYEYIKQLPDEYSIYRDSIMAYSVELFDESKSTPIGVDKTGNTIYDSVFVVYNPLFDTVEINSEFKQFTCFIPDNNVMKDCFTKMNSTYEAIGRPLIDESAEYPYLAQSDMELAINWIKRATIFEGTLSEAEASVPDLYSAYDKQWKNTDMNGNPVQVIDVQNPEELSNGRVYYVQDLKVPNNVVITRLKQFVYHYENITNPDSLAALFCIRGTAGAVKVSDQDAIPTLAANAGADWNSPAFAEYTYTYFANYRVLEATGAEDATEFSVAFSPVTPYAPYKITEYKIPAGEYTLYLGFRSSAMCTGNVCFATADTQNGGLELDPSSADAAGVQDVKLMSPYKLIASNIDFTAATPWNYDRAEGGEMPQYSNGKNRWNSNGGKVGTVTVEGEGMQSVRIKVSYVSGNLKMQLYHWCLVPTENNY